MNRLELKIYPRNFILGLETFFTSTAPL